MDGDAPFAIGRLPITSDEEGIAYVTKLALHESILDLPEREVAVLAADDPDDAGDFRANTEKMAGLLLDLGFAEVTQLHHPLHDVSGTLARSETWEAGYVGYDGHGSAAQIGDYREKFLDAEVIAGLRNGVYPVFAVLTRGTGDDTLPGVRSLASALVLNREGGAIAALAPTGASLDANAQRLGDIFVEKLFGIAEATIGDALLESRLQNRDQLPGYMRHIYSIVSDPSTTAR